MILASLKTGLLDYTDGESSSLLEIGEGYVVINTIIMTVLRWTIAYALLEPSKEDREEEALDDRETPLINGDQERN